MESNTPKDSIPSNEELINSLVSGLEECKVNEEEHNTNDKKNSSDKAKTASSDNYPTSLDEDSLSDESGDTKKLPTAEDDMIDELAMKDRELSYSDEDRQRLQKEAEVFKQNGNDLFKSGQYKESALAYTQALRTCPLAFSKDRAIFYANRAAAKMKMELSESAIEDCTKALELDERYLKVLLRRAQLYESTSKLDEALADYKKVLEIDPLHRDALYSSKWLPEQIRERDEKLKTEMLGKLKELGNMVLKPFGLSTENFLLSQDQGSGGYSINFKS